jgi:hypothetical protein
MSTISYWQADRNWYIQQQIWTLSYFNVAPPPVPKVDQSSDAARASAQAGALHGSNELRSAAIGALELGSNSPYTASLATPGQLLNRST